LPPATNSTPNNQQAHAEVCQGADFVTHSQVETQQCVMILWGDQCDNLTLVGYDFCSECSRLKLCEASGIWHFSGGQNGKCLGGLITIGRHIPPHPVDDGYSDKAPTKRKRFCCDSCRNLWRDTNPRRKRTVEVAKLKNGERSERYSTITNYYNSGQTIILDKQTGRIVERSM
jgi:hypothetical protein